MNGAPIKRRDGTIFVALPREAWRDTGGGCGCEHCKAGALPVWDTLVISTKAPEPGRHDYATTCHYPEFSQPVAGPRVAPLYLSARELATLRALLQAHQTERASLGSVDLELVDLEESDDPPLTDAELAALLGRLGGRS